MLLKKKDTPQLKRSATTQQPDNARKARNINDTIEKESFYSMKKRADDTFLASFQCSFFSLRKYLVEYGMAET